MLHNLNLKTIDVVVMILKQNHNCKNPNPSFNLLFDLKVNKK